MAKFFVLSVLVALSHAAPGNYGRLAAAPLAAAPIAAGLGYAAGPAAVVGTSVQEHVHAGPAVAHTTHEVVGQRTVQVGTQAVQTGVTYSQQQSVHQAPEYTYIAEPAKTTQNTVPIAPPVIPAAPAPYAAIPPAPTNQGPAPADTVTVQKIAAPVRTHTVITPQVRRIEPELQVNKYTVEVPVAVPVPVEREVIYEKKVARPYPVEVPQPYAVPQPYKVHPVKTVVETPVIDRHHVTVQQPVAAVQQVAYAAAPAVAAVAAPAIAAAAPAIAAAPAATIAAAPAAAIGAYAAAPALAYGAAPAQAITYGAAHAAVLKH